ncbi:MAG: DUF4070 domain-containing protein [Phycisphaerae bacterium]|nr:DUF4070 domain-containing protein [Phycisphaerae bacterium]
MKILLVNPTTPDTFWGLKNAVKFIARKAFLPPLGLLTVAAMLPDAWEKKLVDTNTERLRDTDIAWADYVFITGMVIHRASVDQIIARCKDLGTPVVAGGPLFTAAADDFAHVDHLILNEAELTLPRFVADLEAGAPQRVYRTDEKAAMDETPVPLWDLIRMKDYASMCIQSSRGCPFDCDFCDVTTLFGHHFRMKTPEQVLAEMDRIYACGWRGNVFFVDDNFIGNKATLKRTLLPAIEAWMKERDYPFSFYTQASINLADDAPLMASMAAAGFDCVFVGIETPNEQSLRECRKMQNTNRDLKASVARIQQSGLQVQGGFILGFDSDSPTVFDSLIQFIQDSGIVMAMVGLLNAPRGTRLHQRLAGENRLTGDASGNNMDCAINFLPTMGLEKLLSGYRRVVETLYAPRPYCERVLTFFKNYQLPEATRIRVRASELGALLKSVWHIGIIGTGRRHYWRLMGWSVLRPRYFPMAVTFSIYGYHCRKIIKALDERIESMLQDRIALAVSVPQTSA